MVAKYSQTQVDEAIEEQLVGKESVDSGWDDLRFPAERTKKVTGKEPKETTYKGGQILEFIDTASQAIIFNDQLPHGHKLGTDLDFHLHIVLPVGGSNAGFENVKWDFTYTWAEIGGVFPTETTISKTIDIQTLAADTHYLWEIGDVLSANMAIGSHRVSSMLICSLARDHTVVNNSSKHVYFLEADFHHQIDQERGSQTEYEK